MISEELTAEEIGIIRETLEDYVSGLTAEIYGGSRSFGTTEELLHKKSVIEDLIERIETRVA